MRKFWITLWFYFKENFKRNSLIILAVIFIATVGIAFAIDRFAGGVTDVAIVNESSTYIVLEEMLDLPDVSFTFESSANAAREMLEEGDIDYLFVIEGEDRPRLRSIAHEMPNMEVELLLHSILTTMHMNDVLHQYEVPIEVLHELSHPIDVEFEMLADEDDMIAAIILGLIVSWGLYGIILMSGGAIANSVVSEKASRVMEIMLGKVPPTYTMMAKVISGFLNFVLLFVTIIAGGVVANLFGFIDLGSIVDALTDMISLEAALLASIVFILGYLIYALLYAAVGAIATSVESLTTISGPITMAVIIPVLAPTFLDLDGIVLTVLSYVPLFSPFLIVQRFIMGHANMTELVIILGIMLIFTIIVLKMAARIYLNGISHKSESLTFADFKKLLQK